MAHLDPYFTPIGDNAPLDTPDTISEQLPEDSKGYRFVELRSNKLSIVKWLMMSLILLVVFIMTWEVYTTLIELGGARTILGSTFILLILCIIALALIETMRFILGVKQLKQIGVLREQADTYLRERSHGKSRVFLEKFKQFYRNTQQDVLLQQVLSERPDYLNDAELVNYLSENFLDKLDKEVERLITEESVKTATLTAMSPLAIVDGVVVFWRALNMVQKVSNIYGIRLNRINQWKLFIRVAQASLVAAGTEIGISTIVEKSAVGGVGYLAGSLAQAAGLAIYVAKVGVEAKRQSRPITLSEIEGRDSRVLLNAILNKISTLGKVTPQTTMNEKEF